MADSERVTIKISSLDESIGDKTGKLQTEDAREASKGDYALSTAETKGAKITKGKGAETE